MIPDAHGGVRRVRQLDGEGNHPAGTANSLGGSSPAQAATHKTSNPRGGSSVGAVVSSEGHHEGCARSDRT